MGLFDFLKKKETAKISDLAKEIRDLTEENYDLKGKIDELQQYANIIDAKAEAEKIIKEAKSSAQKIIEQANSEAEQIRKQINDLLKATEQNLILSATNCEAMLARAKADADDLVQKTKITTAERDTEALNILNSAHAAAEQIITEAEKQATEIAGDAYKALRNAAELEKTVTALKNIIDGYGTQYIVPTQNLLDDLAEEFGFTEAGNSLKNAREQTRMMAKNGLAATCNYVENNRRETAMAFVTDAFNGKVDSILSRVKKDNYGTLLQKIRDAYQLVNHNGAAFRNAAITTQYFYARVEELKWAVATQELKWREQEEQRAIKERIREEEKARREYEKAIREAEKEEETLKKLIEKAQKEMQQANEEQKAEYEKRLADYEQKLREAEEKNKRAISLAQQTKSGNVYIISNIGSFGENVYKIGMTRRLEPLDRVKELGDASVPFAFDVHAMIYSANAPKLETSLHKIFLANQVNKMNPRKEFFRIPLSEIKKYVEENGLETKWTIAAEARQYRETLALEKSMQENENMRAEWEASQLTYKHDFDEPENEENN